MLRFHVLIHGETDAHAPSTAIAISFDAALAQLLQLPRLFIEPDGSFVWRGTDVAGHEWQVDGNLIDRGDVLAHVELKGSCPEKQLNELLPALGWPDQGLAFQLPRRGIVLSEGEFRALAALPEGAI